MSNDLILCELCYPNWAVASTSDQDGWLIKDQIQVVTNPVDIGPDQDPDTTPWKYGIAWVDGHSESVFEFPVAPIPDPLDGFSDDEIDNLPEEEFKDKCFNWVRDADLIEKPLYEWLNDPFTCYEFVKLFVDNGYNRKEDGYFHQYIFHQVGKMRMSFEDPSYIQEIMRIYLYDAFVFTDFAGNKDLLVAMNVTAKGKYYFSRFMNQDLKYMVHHILPIETFDKMVELEYIVKDNSLNSLKFTQKVMEFYSSEQIGI